MKTSRGSKSFLIPLLVFAFAACSLRGETLVSVPTTPGSGITIRFTTPLTQMPHFGFLPVRATVENLSASDATWDLQFQLGNNGAAAPLTLTSRHNLAAPAGQTRETWLFLPVARAGFAANASGGPGSTGRRSVITKTATGTRLTRTLGGPGGPTLMTTTIDINESTGEMTTQNVNSAGVVLNTNTSRPPPGMSVTYTMDTVRGAVIPRYRPDMGAFKVTVVNSGSPAAVPLSAAVAPKITITPTPTGTKLTRVTDTFTEEQDFDTTAGVIRISRTGPSGFSSKNTRSMAGTTPGTVSTYTINPTDGSVVAQTSRGPDSSAPPKMVVVIGPAGAPRSTMATVPVSPPIGNPIMTTVVGEISGPGLSGLVRVAFPNNLAGNLMRPFAVSTALESEFRAVLASQVAGAPNLAAVTVAQLPADWRIWCSFAGVILTVDEYAALDASRRGALRGWVGLGGQLFLVPTNPGEARVETLGAGRIVTLASLVASVGGPALPTTLNLFAETVALPDRESLFLKDTALGQVIKAEDGDSSWIAIFLVLFAAVIGPVNLFVFAPSHRRHRLFWTTPALALLGGVVLSATIFFQDGLGGSGRRTALVVLLPGQNQAAVFQEQAGRTGFLTRRSFALEGDVVLAPLAVEAETFRMGMWAATNVSRDAGQASGDWFRSRSTPSHMLRRLTPTRGRVELAGAAPDGAPIVESSLATVLRQFVLLDAAGKFWSAREITPGHRVTLEPARGDAPFNSIVPGGTAALSRAYAVATAPTPGRWAALGGETELAPVGTLSSIRWGDTQIAYHRRR